MSSFTCCLSPLPSIPAVPFPAGKWGKAAGDRAGGHRSWSRAPQVCWGIPELGWAGVRAAGTDTAGMPAKPRERPCVGQGLNFPAGLSLHHTQGWSDLKNWRVWAPTGHTGVGTGSTGTLRCYSRPAWGQQQSLAGGLGVTLAGQEGRRKSRVPAMLQRLLLLLPVVFTQPEPGFVVSKATCLPDGKL